MPRLWITLHKEGALLEESPSDSSIEVVLPPEEMATLAALMQLDSYRVAKACGALAMFALTTGHRQSRRVGQPNS